MTKPKTSTKNRRLLGSRPYKNYSEKMLELAVDMVENKRMSSPEAEKRFGIPRRTILNKVKKLHMKPVGGQKKLTDDEKAKLKTKAQLKKLWVNHKTRKNFLSRLKTAGSQTEGESTNFESETSEPVIEDVEDPLANEVKLKFDFDNIPDETPADVLEVLPPEIVQEQMALAINIKNAPFDSSGPSPSFGEYGHADTEDLQQVNSKRIEEREEELHRLQVAEREWLVKAAKEVYLKARLERERAEELLRFRKGKREEAEEENE